MATRSDTQRTAIRERKRQAHVALRQQLDAQQRLQDAAFAALDKLAAQLQRSAELLAGEEGDALQRASSVGAIAGHLDALVADVRRSATELVAGTTLDEAGAADLLGVRTSSLFPRPRSPRVARVSEVAPPVADVAAT